MQLLGGQIFKRPGVVIMSKLAAPLRVLQWSNMTVQLATSIGKGDGRL